MLERVQKGVPREKAPPIPGVLERPDRKAVGERMDPEGELQKGGQMRRGSRGQGRDACVYVGMRQVHSSSVEVPPTGRVGTGAGC